MRHEHAWGLGVQIHDQDVSGKLMSPLSNSIATQILYYKVIIKVKLKNKYLVILQFTNQWEGGKILGTIIPLSENLSQSSLLIWRIVLSVNHSLMTVGSSLQIRF